MFPSQQLVKKKYKIEKNKNILRTNQFDSFNLTRELKMPKKRKKAAKKTKKKAAKKTKKKAKKAKKAKKRKR